MSLPRISLWPRCSAGCGASARSQLLYLSLALAPSPRSIPRPTQRSPQCTQIRHASILSSLSDNPAAYNKKVRKGRGPSSGKGKTSGRGHKGQKQHGKVPAGFQGGQTPMEIVKGKRGFDNYFSVDMSPLNVDRLQSWVDQGRLDPSKPITMKELVDSRCLHGVKDGVKLLGRGASELRTPLNILVSRASASAIAAIEAAGGSITTRYYTPFSIRRIMRGQSLSSSVPLSYSSSTSTLSAEEDTNASNRPKKFLYRLPDPTSRKDIEYYRDPAHRGYLAHLVPEGEGPSLFFRAPSSVSSSSLSSSASTRAGRKIGVVETGAGDGEDGVLAEVGGEVEREATKEKGKGKVKARDAAHKAANRIW